MKRIVVNGKKYDISFKNVENKWWCAYVILKGKKIKNYTVLGNCTYREEDVYGVDTAHAYNSKMTFDEKKEDAERQIRNVIKDYNKV